MQADRAVLLAIRGPMTKGFTILTETVRNRFVERVLFACDKTQTTQSSKEQISLLAE